MENLVNLEANVHYLRHLTIIKSLNFTKLFYSLRKKKIDNEFWPQHNNISSQIILQFILEIYNL